MDHISGSYQHFKLTCFNRNESGKVLFYFMLFVFLKNLRNEPFQFKFLKTSDEKLSKWVMRKRVVKVTCFRPVNKIHWIVLHPCLQPIVKAFKFCQYRLTIGTALIYRLIVMTKLPTQSKSVDKACRSELGETDHKWKIVKNVQEKNDLILDVVP